MPVRMLDDVSWFSAVRRWVNTFARYPDKYHNACDVSSDGTVWVYLLDDHMDYDI